MKPRSSFKIFAFSLLVLLFASSCKKDEVIDTCIEGEGAITTRTLDLDAFSGVELAVAGDATISQGSPQKVEVTGHPNIIDLLKTDVTNGLWVIELEDGCYRDYDLSIEITIPDIDQLALSGSGNLLINDFANQSGQLPVRLAGSGNITLNDFVGISKLDATISGSGSISVNKDMPLESLDLSNSGSGHFFGFKTISDDCIVSSTGSGNVEVTVQNTLDVSLSGSGNVYYKGSPTITQDITGSGNIIDAN